MKKTASTPFVQQGRKLIPVALGLAVLAAAGQAHAQSAYSPYRNDHVSVDLSVLDRLGPAPHVADQRFVLTVVSPQPAHRAPVRVAARKTTAKTPVRVAAKQLEQHGAVTINYAALPATESSQQQRLVLRRPGTQVVAAQAPTQVAQAPAESLTPTPSSVVSLSRPAPTPAPAAPQTPQQQQVATLPASTLNRITPQAGPVESTASLGMGGAAVAATRSPSAPVERAVAPKSNGSAVGFTPGGADLQGDAQSVLDGLATKLAAAPQERVQLVAYAGGNADQAIDARRVSLARAVAVRAYLIQRGVASSRIDVRALGNRVEGGGSSDRVDLVTLAQ